VSETLAQQRQRLAEDSIRMVEQRVNGLEKRVDAVEVNLSTESQRRSEADTDLKLLVADLRSAILTLTNKNHIADFVTQHWKYIFLWLAITAGSDVGKIAELLKVIQ